LALPVVTIVGLTGVTVASAAGRAGDAEQARQVVALGGTAARLTAVLQQERAGAALVLAAGGGSSLADYERLGAATDAVRDEFERRLTEARLPQEFAPLAARIQVDLAGLGEVRETVRSARDAVLSVVAFRYRALISDLIGYRQSLGQVGVSPETASGLRAVAALSQGIESTALLQVAAVRVIAGGRLTPAGQQEVVAADAGISEGLQAFADLGSSGWPALLNSRLGSGPEVVEAERLQGLVVRAQPGRPLGLGVDARGWSTAMGTRIALMHEVEEQLDAGLLAAVTGERDAQRRTIVVAAAVVGVLLLVVVVVGWLIARSLTGSLVRLQRDAMHVAARRLPQMVRDLDVSHADEDAINRLLATAAEPIPVDGGDEVGGVATAFNSVLGSAVRLAGEQAALRAEIAAILVALSRRVQRRADSMTAVLDLLQKDADPEELKLLFRLDHLVTQLRRLIFGLQTMGGGRGGQVRHGDVPLAELLQAAQQEIDGYLRVHTVDADDSVEVHGNVVYDLVHLLAELLDNAAQFSSPQSRVELEARRVGDQVHVQVRDTGVGMTEDVLAASQERVTNPRVDHRATQQMGLTVAGLVAARLGVKVEIRSQPRMGTLVDLTIPGTLFKLVWRPPALPPAPVVPPVPAVPDPPTRLFPSSMPGAVLEAPTAVLPLLGGERAPAPAGWPLPAPVVTATAEPVIYQELQRSSWFHPEDSPPAAPSAGGGGVSAPDGRGGRPVDGWQAVTVAASAVPTQSTVSGLPVREPGRRLIPQQQQQPAGGPSLPAQRDPETVRRSMQSFQSGLQTGQRPVTNHS